MENPLAKLVPQFFGDYPKQFLDLYNQVYIPPEINISIMAALYKQKIPMNQQQIAQLWQNMGRPQSLEEADKFIKASKNYKLLTMEE